MVAWFLFALCGALLFSTPVYAAVATPSSLDQLADDLDGLEDLSDMEVQDLLFDYLASVLSGSLTELEESEDQLFDQAQSYIDQFEFQDPFTQFTAPLSDLSYWLVGIYSNLGSMNIPISFGFTLSIALLLIGWYRFKGGI